MLRSLVYQALLQPGDPVLAPTLLKISYDGKRFLPAMPAVPPGPVVIEVANAGRVRGALLLINWPPELVALTSKPALDFDPYLSGGALLAQQTFRRLFRYAGPAMIHRLRRAWGPPDQSDRWVAVWDLERVRREATGP